jgi:O-antigen ligase
MLALQSSPELDATKLIYFAGTAICLIGSLAASWRLRSSEAAALLAPWFAASAALLVLLVLSFAVSRAGGTSPTAWLRDVAAYGLFVTVPVFALDAQASLSRRALVAMLVVAGLLGGLSWAAEWLARRDIVDLPLSRILLPTGQLPTALYLFASAASLTDRRWRWWALVAGAVLGLFLITGTRSSLILLAGPLAMVVVVARSRRLTASIGHAAVHLIAAFVLVVAFQVSISALAAEASPPGAGAEPGATPGGTADVDVIGDRLGSLPGLLAEPGSDASIRERIAQYQSAWALFVESPIVGVGPGHPIEWVDVSGSHRDDFTADTPLVVPAKFGLAGVLVFAAFVYAFVIVCAASFRRLGRTRLPLTLVGYGVVAALGLPLGFLVEDKGASMALMLLLAVTVAEWGGRVPGQDATADRPPHA